MEQASSQTIASFTGTLLRREHTLGQKFVQLVFRENDKDVLCVSTNPRTATLPIGQTYHVEGEFKNRGEHAFVLDPKIATLKRHWRPIRRVLFGCIVLACVAGIGGVAYMQHGTAQTPTATPPQPLKPKAAAVQTTATPAAVAALAPAPTPAPAPTTAAVKPKTTTAKVANTSAPAPAVTAAPAAVTPVDSCTTQTIQFGTQSQEDGSLAPGTTGSVIQTGVDGSEQVCTLSGTKVTLQPVPEIISVGPSLAQ